MRLENVNIETLFAQGRGRHLLSTENTYISHKQNQQVVLAFSTGKQTYFLNSL